MPASVAPSAPAVPRGQTDEKPNALRQSSSWNLPLLFPPNSSGSQLYQLPLSLEHAH
jgi:hypothetical protein